MRAGARILLMAADPINRGILRSVLERPLELEPGRFYQVSAGGQEALYAGFVVERWLQSAPHGPLNFDGNEAESAVAALADAWSATVVHALAREPLTFVELEKAVEDIGRDELKGHMKAMDEARQIEALPGAGEPLYALTDWMRFGIAPLIASARLERRNPMAGMAPIEPLDVEAGFRLSLPLVEMPKELTGTCSMGLNLAEDESEALTGVTARIEEGRVVAVTTGLDRKANAWAAATATQWLDTVIEPDAKHVRAGGDRWLAEAAVDALHRALFGIPVT
jgi:DNA-binding HxlR family transcriptional regulator